VLQFALMLLFLRRLTETTVPKRFDCRDPHAGRHIFVERDPSHRLYTFLRVEPTKALNVDRFRSSAHRIQALTVHTPGCASSGESSIPRGQPVIGWII